jgi:hypothetical protein
MFEFPLSRSTLSSDPDWRGVPGSAPAEQAAARSAAAAGAAGVVLALQRQAGNQAVSRLLQREVIPVGISKIRTGGRDDALLTTQLANCVAIVAYDERTKRAAMGHLNTGAISSPAGGVFDVAKLVAFKQMLANALQRSAGQAVAPLYHVGLGQEWTDARAQAPRAMTTRLLNSLSAAFPDAFFYEAAGAMIFLIADGRMEGRQISLAAMDARFGPNWSHAGESIDEHRLGRAES